MGWRPVWAVAAVLAAALAVVLRPRRVVVRGESMLPALQAGDRVLLLRLPVRTGDVVALRHPRRPGVVAVKRVAATPGGRCTPPGGAAIDAGDGYVLLGDNPGRSTDARDLGPAPRAALLGRAVYRYAPPHRRGPVLRTRDVGG